MKTLFASLLLAAGTASLLAQLPAVPNEFQSLKIIETAMPIFPETMIASHRNGGQARIVISVDADGKLREWLAVAYTDRAFADQAVSALKEWSFEPARWRGEPVSVSVTLTFDFEVKGVVISTTGSESLDAQLNALLGDARAFTPCTLRELDRIPVPLHSVAPSYSKDLSDKGVTGEVIVEFYIDEEGTVRMPCVVDRPDRALANLAIDAVQQWKFEPPTRNGRPVLVHVRQLFRFKPGLTSTASRG